jgi:hypothetical protein
VNISRPYQLAVAIAEIAQGLVCLLTLTLVRPSWTVYWRLRGLQALCADAPKGENS